MSINDKLVSSLRELSRRSPLEYLGSEHELRALLSSACTGLRQHLLSQEEEIVRLSEATSYWDLTPKYRFDLLVFDIPSVANQLAFSVWLATLHLDHLAEAESSYFPTWSDVLFWYHVDFGVRLVSSAWDRTALLLDLAFELESGAGCKLPTVLRRLPAVDDSVVHVEGFKRLKAFRDGRFRELEEGPGAGARHEATHLVSPSTRHLAEFVESVTGEASGKKPQEWIAFLHDHHGMYLDGLEHGLRLVERRWPTS